MPSRILIVDDEPNILVSVRTLLIESGYEVATARTARELFARIAHEAIDVIVLDLGLPDMSGVEVCRLLREGHAIPIIVLSARGAESDKVAALDAGADDYVTKPFGVEELLARIRAALRRAASVLPTVGLVVCGDLTIDRTRRRVMRADIEIRLTPKEFDLLSFMAEHAGRVLTHRTLLKALWGANAVDEPQHLRVLVAALRKKVERDSTRPAYIVTEPWVGYRFEAADRADADDDVRG